MAETEAPEASPAASPASTVTLEAVKLGGEGVWGPEAIPSDLSCDELRRCVAKALQVRWRAVQLAFKEQALEGPEKLEKKGLVEGSYQLQVVLQDRSQEIRKIQEAIASCSKTGGVITLTEGLSDDEVVALEKRYGFTFPPEFLEFLQAGVLVGEGWHDWHTLASGSILPGFKGDSVADQIRWHCTPEEADYWSEGEWAPPEEKTVEKAVELATKTYPVIPMRNHRCTVTVPHGYGLPVVSMHQCEDNQPFGKNFWEWVARDCDLPEGTVPTEWIEVPSVPWEEVPFWRYWTG